VLAAGEPGFEVSTNTLKIGDGTSTWAQLPIANKAAIDALIKVTDDKVEALSEAVSKLDDTYATDAEVEAVRSALDSAKLDKATYNEYIASHAMTDTQITEAINAVDAKFADYTTTTAQQAIDAEQDRRLGVIEGAYATKADVEAVATDLSNYETANDEALAEVKSDVEDLEKYVGTIPSGYTEETVIAYINKKAEETLNTASGGSSESAASVLAALNTYKAENDPKVNANTEAIAAINNEETGVLAQAKAYVDSEDVFHTDIKTVNGLGGIAAGADLNNMTTHEILNTLLFPYVAFTINSTSRNAAAATLECGNSQTLNSASISITKKSKPITSVKLLNGSTVLGEKTGDEVAAGGTITFSNLGITVDKNNNPNLKFTVTDGQTSTDKNVGASTFVYPYYWGVCAANATIDETLVEGLTKKVEAKGTKTDIAFTCANQKIVFAYPKAHGVLKSIIDPNNFEIIGDFTRSEVDITGLDETTQTYYVYVSGASTVSDFLIDFKY
jgi:hypothetical protein